MGRPYSSPNFSGNHIVCLGKIDSNASVDTSQAKFAAYMNAKVTEVFVVVQAAGTATDAGYTIKKGTSSVGAITVGTAAAGSIKAADLTDTNLTSTDVLHIHNITSDTQQEAYVYVVYQERFTNS